MKFKVSRQTDYVMGNIRYGHLEGVIEANSLEDAIKKVEEEGYSDVLDLVVDDYEVEDFSCGDNEFKYEEVKED